MGLEGPDQCLHGLQVHQDVSPRTKLDKAMYDNVVSRWSELGLSGTAPVITVFEDKTSAKDVT